MHNQDLKYNFDQITMMRLPVLMALLLLISSFGYATIISGQVFDASNNKPVDYIPVELNNKVMAFTDQNGHFSFETDPVKDKVELHFFGLEFKDLTISNISPDNSGSIKLDSIYVFRGAIDNMGCTFSNNWLQRLKLKMKLKKRARQDRRMEKRTLPLMVKNRSLRYDNKDFAYQIVKGKHNEITGILVDVGN